VNERERPVAFALDAKRCRLVLAQSEKASDVFFDRLGERGLRGPVESLEHGEGQSERSVRWPGPNRSQLRKAHQKRADQTDGIGILDA